MIFLLTIILWLLAIGVCLSVWRLTKRIKLRNARIAIRTAVLVLVLVPVPGFHWYGLPVPLVFQMLEMLPTYMTPIQSYAIQGQILKEGTKEPASGAIVLGLWGHQGPTTFMCVHAQSGITDSKGNYHLVPKDGYQLRISLRNTVTKILAHKKNYRMKVERSDKGGLKVESYSLIAGKGYLLPFSGSNQERLEYLRRMAEVVVCPGIGTGKKNLLSMHKTLYEDAKDIGATEEEKRIVDQLCRSFAYIAVQVDGLFPAPGELDSLIKQYLERNLPECLH